MFEASRPSAQMRLTNVATGSVIAPANLQSAFRAIRSYLAVNTVGAGRDEEFLKQTLKLVFCKLYDETTANRELPARFYADDNEPASETADRISLLFDDMRAAYPFIWDTEDRLGLDDETITYVVKQLQQFVLSVEDRDVVSEAFETMIGDTLKASQGQFFTPRNVVKLLVEMIVPCADDLIIDPACGSGGFLVECLSHVLRSESSGSSERAGRIVGLDRDEFLCRVANAHMQLTGSIGTSVFCEDSLRRQESWQNTTRQHIGLGEFDIVVSNPPFGQDIQVTEPSTLAQFSLAHKTTASGRSVANRLKSSVRPEILFIERNLQFLKPGGVMAVVLPETFLHAPKSRHVMNFLREGNNIQWIVDLPPNTFRPHTNAKCVAILVQKGRDQDKMIRLVVAEQMGHDHHGKPLYRYDNETQEVDETAVWDDIPEITETIKEGRTSRHVFSVPTQRCADTEVYVPRYYQQANQPETANVDEQADYELITLRQMIDNGQVTHFDGHGSPKSEHKGQGDHPYVRVKDIVNWEIYKDPTDKVPAHVFNQIAAPDKRLREHDVLFVKRGSNRIGSVAMASKFDVDCLLTREILVLRVNSQHEHPLSSYYLLWLLAHQVTQTQIPNKVLIDTTLPNIGNRWLELRLPVHRDRSTRNLVAQQVEQVIQAKWDAVRLLKVLASGHHSLAI